MSKKDIGHLMRAKPRAGQEQKDVNDIFDELATIAPAAPVAATTGRLGFTAEQLKNCLIFVDRFATNFRMSKAAKPAAIAAGAEDDEAQAMAKIILDSPMSSFIVNEAQSKLSTLLNADSITSKEILNQMIAVAISAGKDSDKITALEKVGRLLKEVEESRMILENTRPVILLPKREIDAYDEVLRAGGFNEEDGDDE